jgi:2-amino-4-hydroxy-6-hydroxymethyldihydropteridine diphosphokinase
VADDLAAVDVYLSLGSNIEPEKHLRLACAGLADAYGELQLSPVYKTPAVGFEGDDFLNMAVGLRTDQSAMQIVEFLESLHVKAGRIRQANPFSARTLDVDLLLYGDLVSQQPALPHADIEKYAFVLAPLALLAPQLKHPVLGHTLQELWQGFAKHDQPLQRVELELL